MITSLVGKSFLKAYNEKNAVKYSAKEFFEKVYFELFFNHNKYLMTGGNSPFENPKISWSKMLSGKIPYETEERRLQRLEAFLKKAEESDRLDASIAMGYPASDEKEFAVTSGLVSDIPNLSKTDDLYTSWIGAGLGLMVTGGYSILINDASILMYVFEGWEHYRNYLNTPSLDKLKGNQINTWNGQWLTYRLSKSYKKDFTFRDLEQEGVFKVATSGVEVNTVKWTNLFFSLSSHYSDMTLGAYIYSFVQMNKTLGFVPFYLKSGRRMIDVFKQLYSNESDFNNRGFQELFGIHIKRAVELGSVGLHALQPQTLGKYFQTEQNLRFNKESDIINYKSYKTWLVAMLSKNKEEITDYTMEVAELLLRYRSASKGTKGKNLIEKELLASKSKRNFIDSLVEVMHDLEGDDVEKVKELRNHIHLMNHEDFVYFNTLLKFDYKFAEKKS